MDTFLTFLELITDFITAKPHRLLDKYIRPDKKNKLLMNVLSVLMVISIIILGIIILGFILINFT